MPAAAWYASPSGNATAAGTLADPWDLQTALNGGFPGGSVQPGDTIWCRGGIYNKTDTNWSTTLTGTAQNPIIVRNYRGDQPLQQERVRIRETNTSPAASAGAITVNGVNGAGSATVSVNKASNAQAVSVGHQLTIASGPAAGVYVITAGVTIATPGPTSVSITPNLRGATTGGETVTLTLTPTSIDSLKFDGGNYLRFWGIEFDVIVSLRSIAGGGICFSHFGTNNNGIKLIHCILHDGQGNCFIDYQSNDMEVYGCLLYNAGNADTGNGDGGAHQFYIHHKNVTPRLNIERNVMFNDHGVALQCYSTAGVRDFEEGINLLYNVIANAGVLNNVVNIGGKDSTSLELGGAAETMSEITVDHNYIYNAVGHGDRQIQLGFNSTGRLGANLVVTHNYAHGGGSGFGCMHFNGTLAGGGTVDCESNTFVVQAAAASWNGNAARFADANPAPAGWTVRNNIYYRVAGLSEPPISAFPTVTHAFGTIAQWQTDTGFVTDTSPSANPTLTLVVTIPATKYETARGWVIYYNYANLTQIPFNPADFGIGVGDTFMVHDMRNVWAGVGTEPGSPIIGPTIYQGGLVNLPNTQLADPVQTGAQPGIGNETAPPATAPTFNAFLVRRTAAATQQSTPVFPPPQPELLIYSSPSLAIPWTDRITGVVGTVLTLSFAPLVAGVQLNALMVFKNGARLDPSTYSIAGTALTLTVAATAPDIFVVDYCYQGGIVT